MTVSPYFDSMLVKYTVRGSSFTEAVARMKRVLQECRIRGVKTNIGFLMNVLAHPEFSTGMITTSFIDENPDLKKTSTSKWDYANEDQADAEKLDETDRLLRYLANLAVNGHPAELASACSLNLCSSGRVLVQSGGTASIYVIVFLFSFYVCE